MKAVIPPAPIFFSPQPLSFLSAKLFSSVWCQYDYLTESEPRPSQILNNRLHIWNSTLGLLQQKSHNTQLEKTHRKSKIANFHSMHLFSVYTIFSAKILATNFSPFYVLRCKTAQARVASWWRRYLYLHFLTHLITQVWNRHSEISTNGRCVVLCFDKSSSMCLQRIIIHSLKNSLKLSLRLWSPTLLKVLIFVKCVASISLSPVPNP